MQIKPILILTALLLAACSLPELPPPRSHPRDIVMDAALAQVDRPYRYRGDDPTGFDASGLVRYVLAQGGIDLPHSLEGQHALGKTVPFDRIQRGDLLFYQSDNPPQPQMHVGIYVGQSRMVHVADSDRVQVESIDTPYWQRRFLDAVSHLP